MNKKIDEVYPNMLSQKLKILILCNPCHGFGDVIFAMKLMKYIVVFYKSKVKIATTTPDSFIKLGASKTYIIPLDTSSSLQCRRFARLSSKKPIDAYDLYFVAPLPADNKISQRDISILIPSANKDNTIFFSEYNDNLKKGFDFNTGIGRGRDGIFITEIPRSVNSYKSLGKYAVAYLAESIDKSEQCFLNFLSMVSKKYELLKFTIVAPDWIADIKDNKLKKHLSKYYGRINIHTKSEELQIDVGSGHGILNLKCDIFPVPNKDMLTLMKYSVDDILLTGDQSITDALSCCSNKNIFYQIAPWKANFAKNLANHLPNPYLSKKSTSCGTVKAVSYKSDYTKFIKTWDFRYRGKAKLDTVIERGIACAQRPKAGINMI